MKWLFILALLMATLSATYNVTAVKTCANSTDQINTCANATNIVGDGINWTLKESTLGPTPYNGTINLTNYTFLYGVENITLLSHAGTFETSGVADAQLRVFNYTNNTWLTLGTLSANAFGWINASLNRTDFVRNQSVWVAYVHPSNAIPTDIGIEVDYFGVRVVEYINPVINAPVEGNVIFGQCWVLVNLTTYDNTPNESHTASCQMWYSDGQLNSTYTLIQTLTGLDNDTFNFTNISATVSGAGRYRLNCTVTEGAVVGYSQSVNTQLTGTAYCPNGTNAATNSLEYPIVALVMLSIIFIYFRGYWDTLNPFLAPLSNFLAILGLVSLSVAMYAIFTLTGDTYATAFYIAIFSFVVYGLYLMLRMFVMAWTTLKAVMDGWRR